MLSTEVPRIGAPRAASGAANPIAVCPPNCVTMGGRPEGDLNSVDSASAAEGELNAKFAKDAKGRKEDKETDAAATDATDDLTSMTASEAGAFFSPLRDFADLCVLCVSSGGLPATVESLILGARLVSPASFSRMASTLSSSSDSK